ncbi:hypothetical protein ACFFLS_00385 [Flavobacterium procerum]|uniref:Uncharacterized protein n=1 Tax=Flavobacterium procerum TaxID=1455569 RepID=A0ABV6BJ62_9FLAO
MKTNLKLSKITISKLDNLNFKPLENGELINLKGGGGDPINTGTSTVPYGPSQTSPVSVGPVIIYTAGGSTGYNDTTHLSSCQVDIEGNYSYTECIGRDS